jgi:hypothetical protein
VLAPDDSKNIFTGRPSYAATGADMIEGSDNKKPGTSESRRRKKKKTVLRKVVKGSTCEEMKKEDSVEDDGF